MRGIPALPNLGSLGRERFPLVVKALLALLIALAALILLSALLGG